MGNDTHLKAGRRALSSVRLLWGLRRDQGHPGRGAEAVRSGCTPQPEGARGARHLPPEAAAGVPACPRQVLSNMKGLAGPSGVIKRGYLPAYLSLARSPGEGSIVQPWVLGVFILPKLPKGSAGWETAFLNPCPEAALSLPLEGPSTWVPWAASSGGCCALSRGLPLRTQASWLGWPPDSSHFRGRSPA